MSTTPTVPQSQEEPDVLQGATPVASEAGAETQSTLGLYWRKIWNGIGDYNYLPNLKKAVEQDDIEQQQIVQNELAHDHEYRAMIAAGYYAVLQTGAHMALGIATPKQTAIQLSGGSSLRSVKAAWFAANTYFAYRGGQEMLTPQQPGETPVEAAGRRVAAGGQTVLSLIGAGTTASEALHSFAQKQLGLSGDLAAKVSEKLVKAEQIRMEGKAEADSAAQIGQGTQERVAAETSQRLNTLTADASQTVILEKARVEATYEDALRRATGPVTTVADLNAEINNTLKDNGIQQSEIPSKIFNALPKQTTDLRALTASESKAAILAKQLQNQGLSQADIRSAMVNLSFTPRQIDAIMTVGAGIKPETTVDFQMATRVANDLYSAAQSAKDSSLRNALMEAYQNVGGMKARAATEQGWGPTYKKANQQYAEFKNNLGVGMMSDFIAASDIVEKNMMKRMALVLQEQNGIAGPMSDLLKAAGVDVSPLKAAIAEQEAVASATEQGAKAIEQTTAARTKALGEQNAIVKGESDLSLGGKTTLQIRQEAVQALINNSRKAGIANPYAFTQIMYGAWLSSLGSFFGAAHLLRGLAPAGFQKMLGSKGFQNWVIAESGVTAQAAPAVRRAIASSGPWMVRMTDQMAAEANAATQTSVIPRAADAAIQQQKEKAKEVRTVAPQQAAPIRPPAAGRGIGISQ